jgi:hypothetical protein
VLSIGYRIPWADQRERVWHRVYVVSFGPFCRFLSRPRRSTLSGVVDNRGATRQT